MILGELGWRAAFKREREILGDRRHVIVSKGARSGAETLTGHSQKLATGQSIQVRVGREVDDREVAERDAARTRQQACSGEVHVQLERQNESTKKARRWGGWIDQIAV